MSTLSEQYSTMGSVNTSPGPDTRLNRPKRSTTIRSHCCAMCTVDTASHPATKATATLTVSNAPAASHHRPSTNPNAAAKSAIENTSAPAFEAT